MDMRSIVESNIRLCFEDLEALAIKTIDSPKELADVRGLIDTLSVKLGTAAQRTLARIEEQERRNGMLRAEARAVDKR